MDIKKVFLYILFFKFIFSIINIHSQELVKHEKRMWINSEGRFFVQKSLPLYIRASYINDKNSHLLKSNVSKNVAPLYLANEGENILYSSPAVDTITKKLVQPKRNLEFEIYADSKSPNSKIAFSNMKIKNSKQKLYINKNSELSITANDIVSGVNTIYYSINKKDFAKYNSPISFNEVKDFLLQYYSIDNVGNIENIKNFNFKLDTIPPVSNIRIIGDSIKNIFSIRSKITIIANDFNSGVKNSLFKIDNKAETLYKYKIYLNKLKEGEHSISYYSNDIANNKEGLINYKFYIDKTPPIVIDEIIGDFFFINGKTYTSSRTKFKLTAIDNKSGVKAIYYSLNNSEFKQYKGSFYLPRNSKKIQIKSYAVDKVNNKSKVNKGRKSISIAYIDITAPVLNHKYIGKTITIANKLFLSPKTKIILSAIDNESGMKNITYNANNSNELSYSKPIQFDKEGFYSFNYLGYDNVGNSNRDNFEFYIDSKGPEINVYYSVNTSGYQKINENNIPKYPKYLNIYLSATDINTGVDRIEYSINNRATKVFNNLIKGLSKGLNKIKITAYDILGNKNVKDISIYIF